jgi:hypothetical protein
MTVCKNAAGQVAHQKTLMYPCVLRVPAESAATDVVYGGALELNRLGCACVAGACSSWCRVHHTAHAERGKAGTGTGGVKSVWIQSVR